MQDQHVKVVEIRLHFVPGFSPAPITARGSLPACFELAPAPNPVRDRNIDIVVSPHHGALPAEEASPYYIGQASPRRAFVQRYAVRHRGTQGQVLRDGPALNVTREVHTC